MNESEPYNTRKKKTSTTIELVPPVKEETIRFNDPASSSSGKTISTAATQSKGKYKGNMWTEEEQVRLDLILCLSFDCRVGKGRLEELLQLYPPEEVEAKRWQKIANALGNRTPKQVRRDKQIYQCLFYLLK